MSLLPVAIVLSVFTGICVMRLAWRNPVWSRATLPQATLWWSAAISIGLGVSSCAYFLSLFLRGFMPWPHVLVDVSLLILSALVAWRVVPSPRSFEAVTDSSRLTRVLLGVLAVVVVLCVVAIVRGVVAFPLGAPDGYMIWNLRARYFHLTGEDWRRAFAKPLYWSHTDYPLLLPATVARLWDYARGETTWVPRLLGPAYLLLTVAVTFGVVGILRGLTQALLAVIALLALPGFVFHSVSQYAEPPLSLYMLLSFAMLALSLHDGAKHIRLLALAGVSCGLVAWTKNEGALFAVCYVLSLVVGLPCLLGVRGGARAFGAFLLGFVPIAAIIVLMKFGLDFRNDLVFNVTQQDTTIWQRATDWSYQKHIFATFWNNVFAYRESAIYFLLPVYAVVMGLASRVPARGALWIGLLCLALLYAGYYAVFTISTREVTYVAMSRLFANPWPCVVVWCFLAVRGPSDPDMRRASVQHEGRGALKPD